MAGRGATAALRVVGAADGRGRGAQARHGGAARPGRSRHSDNHPVYCITYVDISDYLYRIYRVASEWLQRLRLGLARGLHERRGRPFAAVRERRAAQSWLMVLV